MNEAIRKLAPQGIWNNFADLNANPRPSKKEEKVRKFLVDFGKSLNLETVVDSTGNVIIKKPATKGMENRKKVVLQGHMDMVTQKNNDVQHDFENEGISMKVDGDWVRAEGTTLGADNGLGVATIMTILQSEDIPHPAIEALITYDEETGMTGALKLDDDVLTGDILLNLDTEEDDEIDIGCAGGIDITAVKHYKEVDVASGAEAFRISLTGLEGGHSGMDIDKGRGNANQLMNRILYIAAIKADIQIATIQGGGLRNAIPRESVAEVLVSPDKIDAFNKVIKAEIKAVKKEYASLEKQMKFLIEGISAPAKAMDAETTKEFVRAIYAVHNGVYRMSPDIEDLVETSNNIARVEVADGKAEIQCLTRSSVETGKQDLTHKISVALELGGFKVKADNGYPGWQPNPDSEILRLVTDIYKKQNGEDPVVMACHAGLECGILLSHYPKMETLSFGPTIKGAHSPDERASIKSTQKFWKFLKEILANIPEK